MNVQPLDPANFYHAVQRGVRSAAGKALAPALKRWRNTRSGEFAVPNLTPAMMRFLFRYGVLDAGASPDEQQKTFTALLGRMCRTSGDAPGVIGAWVAAFALGEYGVFADGVCGETPRCPECPLCDSCRFLCGGARAIQVSGAALAQTLSASETQRLVRPRAAELLAFLLSEGRGGAAALARTEALLRALGGLRGVLAAPAQDLRIAGLDPAGVARLRAVAELFGLWVEEEQPGRKAFTKGKDFFEHYRLRVRGLKKERFYVVCLDQQNRLLGDELVSEGTLTQALVHPREVFGPAIRMQAAAVAVVHNHPSGSPRPSLEDKTLTTQLRQAADLLGIRLLDHVIVGDGTYTSFVEEGLL